MTSTIVSPYVTVRELAILLRTTEETIRAAHQDGRLPFKGIRIANKGRSPILFERAAVARHFEAIGNQAQAELDLYQALQDVAGLSSKKAAEVVQALHEGTLSHDEVREALASRVAK